MKELCHHVNNLLLRRLAVARHILLNLHRRSLYDGKAVLRCCKENDTTCLTDGNRRCNIPIEEQLFYAHDLGLVLFNQCIKRIVNLHQTVFHAHFRHGEDRAISQRPKTTADRFDEAVSTNRRSGVNAKCYHAFLS